jgi:predicted amidohydrolase YtcJ
VKHLAAVTLTLTTTLAGADLILYNSRIWTGNPSQPEAQAVASQNGRILAVGTDAEVRKLATASTRLVDLRGRRLVPGFNDSHVHFADGGRNLSSVQLRDARSESEFRDRIAAFAKTQPAGRWILGGDWDHENWSPARLPTRSLVDAATPDHPLFVNRLDGHMALANSLALRLAGITRATADPPGGTIVRDANGEPTGVLKDAAMDLVSKVIPAPSESELIEAIRAAMRYANQNGVTSVTDMSASPEVLRAYQALRARGELTVRITGHQPLDTWQRQAAVGIRAGFGDDFLKIGALKGFADGSLGSTTALFFDNYLDEPGSQGLALMEEAEMFDLVKKADSAGLQIAIHAIGDRANNLVLGIFDRVARENGARDRRFRIEHAQHLRPQEIAAFARQGVIASMQPYHAIDDGRWAEKRIGVERAKGTYAFRSLLDAGAVLAFGSDWYVAPIDPLAAIYGAVTRRTIDGKRPGGWVPEQRITVAEAVRAYTWGSAYASFDEKKKGTIAPGFLADFAVLSADIFRLEPVAIEKVRVEMTVVDGRIVWGQ